jgi:DNA polymerase III epsilon subunit-like protein
MNPSCDPGHQCVVLNAIKKRVEIKIDAPHRAISDELACALHSLMLRAPRPKAEAVGWKCGSKTGVSTCVMAWQINRSTAAGTPNFRRPPEGLGIITLLTGCGR